MLFVNMGSYNFIKSNKNHLKKDSERKNILSFFELENIRTLHLLPMAEINDDHYVNPTEGQKCK